MASKKTSKKTSKKKAASATESKADKFKRLAEMRTTKAINAMRGLQKLSNSNNYEFTDEQVTKICEALKAEVVDLHEAFTKTGGTAKETFTL